MNPLQEVVSPPGLGRGGLVRPRAARCSEVLRGAPRYSEVDHRRLCLPTSRSALTYNSVLYEPFES